MVFPIGRHQRILLERERRKILRKMRKRSPDSATMFIFFTRKEVKLFVKHHDVVFLS